MSAIIRQLVLKKRAAQTQAEIDTQRVEQLIAAAKGDPGPTGDPGPSGPPPAHEWRGTKLRFRQPDGTWGKWVDLRGTPGDPGATIVSRSGGASFNPASLPLFKSPPSLSDTLVLESGGTPWRISLAQLQQLFGIVPNNVVTINGDPLTVNGEYITAT